MSRLFSCQTVGGSTAAVIIHLLPKLSAISVRHGVLHSLVRTATSTETGNRGDNVRDPVELRGANAPLRVVVGLLPGGELREHGDGKHGG